VKEALIDAAMAHFEAQERVAGANLRVYLTHAVGVAATPLQAGKIVNLTKQIAEGGECTAVLSELTHDD